MSARQHSLLHSCRSPWHDDPCSWRGLEQGGKEGGKKGRREEGGGKEDRWKGEEASKLLSAADDTCIS